MCILYYREKKTHCALGDDLFSRPALADFEALLVLEADFDSAFRSESLKSKMSSLTIYVNGKRKLTSYSLKSVSWRRSTYPEPKPPPPASRWRCHRLRKSPFLIINIDIWLGASKLLLLVRQTLNALMLNCLDTQSHTLTQKSHKKWMSPLPQKFYTECSTTLILFYCNVKETQYFIKLTKEKKHHHKTTSRNNRTVSN